MPRPSSEDLFWSKVDKNGPTPMHAPELGPCWVWTGYRMLSGAGHGQLRRWVEGEPRAFLTHRFSYSLVHGPIPPGVELDHQCRNPGCVRTSHLRPGTHKENMENLGLDRRNQSGHRGVSWRKDAKKWGVYVNNNGKTVYGGVFDDVEDAARRAREMRAEMYQNNVDYREIAKEES